MVVRNMQQTPMNGPASSCRASRTPASAVRDRTIKSSNSNVKVVVRIRPENIKEKDGNFSNVVQALDDHILVFDPADDSKDGFGSAGARRYDILKKKSRDMRFAFDRVFDPNATNRQVYEHCVRSILDCLLNGINCSVFAYGATGAGKTHTMLGNMECPGVTFHTMMELYERIEDMKDEKSCDVAVSYLEIYNETIQDLLKPSGALPIREDPNSGIVIKGLTLHKPKDAKDLLEMLYYGNQNRTQHPTDANKESSRSHAVFQVFVRQKDRTASLTADIHMAKMSLIDLAGSERATATANRGARLREGANINRSLLALGNVINALADGRNSGKKNQHIPYRDSKLTRLLKDSIGGNCSTVMITAVSPSAMSYEDTLNSLKYADRAKNIKATLKKNVLSVDMHVSRYVKIVEELRTEISELKLKLQSYEGGLMTPFHQRQADTAKQEDINRLKTLFSTIFTKRLSLRNEIMEYECSERDLTLKIHQKQQVLSRLGVVSSDKTRSEKVHSKLNHAIDAAEKRRDTILSRKADVNSRLKENNDWFTRTESEAKLIGENCNALPEVLRDFVKMRRLEVEVRDSRRQVKHLQKVARQQDSEQENMNRLVVTLMRTVKKQYYLMKGAGLATADVIADYNSCENLVLGSREIVWDDRKRSSSVHRGFDIQEVLDFPAHVICSPIVYNPKMENPTRRRSLAEHFEESNLSPIATVQRTPAAENRRVNYAGRTPIPKMNLNLMETTQEKIDENAVVDSVRTPCRDATVTIKSAVTTSSPASVAAVNNVDVCSDSPSQNDTFTINEEGIPEEAPVTPVVSQRPIRKMVSICPGTYVKSKSSSDEFHVKPVPAMRTMSYADAVKSPPLAVPLADSSFSEENSTSKTKAELRLKFNEISPATKEKTPTTAKRGNLKEIQNLDLNVDDDRDSVLDRLNLPRLSPGKRRLAEHVAAANQRRQTIAASRVSNNHNTNHRGTAPGPEPKRVSLYHKKTTTAVSAPSRQTYLEKFGIPSLSQRSLLKSKTGRIGGDNVGGAGGVAASKPSYMALTKAAQARKTDNSHKRSVSMKENQPNNHGNLRQNASRVPGKHHKSMTANSRTAVS